MIAVLFFAGLVAGGVGGSLGTHRYTINRVRQADIHHYEGAWDPDDRRALTEELAVAVADKGRYRRHAVWLEQVARRQAGLLASRWRRPIPLPAASPGSYRLDYGSHR